ncbi:MAG: hypothetical protein JXA10_18455 [Anaerolineae bacterium]|nr:hypothetical protein [Anaerolineae bacterium]
MVTPEMQRCPACGAYVMSNDDYCPRCDHRLNDPLPKNEPERAASTSPGAGAPTSPSAADDQSAQKYAPPAVPIFADTTAIDDEDTADIDTQPNLSNSLNAADDSDSFELFDHSADHPAAVGDDTDPMDLTHPAIKLQAQRHAAPYTPPPPVHILPPTYTPPVYTPAAVPPTIAFLQQRVDEYRRGGYRLRAHRPDEAVLSYGKNLGVGGWVLALLSIIGALWYLMLLALSGFQRDSVYIVLESDGYVYEDGPGAAHVRRQRTRVGRRWAAFGVVILVVSLLLTIGLGIVGGIVLTQERYQAALREAYPAVTLFEEQFSATKAAPDDVQLAKDGAVVFAILGGIALVGLWGGATLVVIGSIHAGAYQVRVPALPGWD